MSWTKRGQTQAGWPKPRLSVAPEPPRRRVQLIARWLAAGIGLPLAAFALQSSVWPYVAPFAWILFYPVIFIGPRLGGRWSGLLATACSALIVCWWFIPPEGSLQLDRKPLWSVGVFVLLGGAFELFHTRLREAERDAQAALQALRKADQRKDEYLATVADPVVIVSEEGSIEYVNAKAELVFGYAEHELIGMSHDLLIPVRFFPAHTHHVARFFREPSARPMGGAARELVARRKDGSEFPCEVSLNPVTTSRGTMVSTVVRDISERRRLASAASLQSERLRGAIEAIPDPFWITDREGRLASFNDAFRRIAHEIGFEPSVGMQYSQVVAGSEALFVPMNESDRTQFMQRRASARSDEGTAADEVCTTGGRTFRVSMRTTTGGDSVNVAFEITDDLRHTRELEQARVAAEAASKAKTEFLASMSHELRTPMNSVLGFAQLLRRAKGEKLSERQLQMVDHILSGGDQLLRLIDEVLDLARIEAQEVAPPTEPVSVAQILQEVITSLQPAAFATGVELLRSGVAIGTVDADRGRFAQILVNLGSNAIKYNRPGGHVTFLISESADSIRVTVADTGLGISADKQAQLFQPFYRAGQETGPISGTGIGLTISRRLAELMDGSVGYQSREIGSEFWVELPRHQPCPPTPESAPEPR